MNANTKASNELENGSCEMVEVGCCGWMMINLGAWFHKEQGKNIITVIYGKMNWVRDRIRSSSNLGKCGALSSLYSFAVPFLLIRSGCSLDSLLVCLLNGVPIIFQFHRISPTYPNKAKEASPVSAAAERWQWLKECRTIA